MALVAVPKFDFQEHMKFFWFLLVCIGLGWAFLSLRSVEAADAVPPVIFGRAAVLCDANTGEILYKKNEQLKTPIASTQKLLTALIVAEGGYLDKTVCIATEDTQVEPTKLYLKAGDSYVCYDLLTVLLVKSANDVAYALGRHHGGNIEKFAQMMNEKALSLGAKNSHFINPNGLPVSGQYSTALDLACIAKAAYHNSILRGIFNQKSCHFTYANGKTITLNNTNRVLRTYDFCNGMKTGYTVESGHCLVASGIWEGKEVIAVVLKSDKAHVWKDATLLLRYGLGMPTLSTVNKGELGSGSVVHQKSIKKQPSSEKKRKKKDVSSL